MSDNSGNGVSVLRCVSGCYAEVHISWEISLSISLNSSRLGNNGEVTVIVSLFIIQYLKGADRSFLTLTFYIREINLPSLYSFK